MILQIMDVKKQEDEVSLGTSVAFLNDNGDCGLCYVRPKNLRRSTQVFTNMNMDALSFFIHAYIIFVSILHFLCFSLLWFASSKSSSSSLRTRWSCTGVSYRQLGTS